MRDTHVTNDGIREISRFKTLTHLDLSDTIIFDEASAHWFGALVNLRSIHLSGTGVAGESLRWLSSLAELEDIGLANAVGVDDDAVSRLKGLTQLKSLHLGGTAITDAALADIDVRVDRRKHLFGPPAHLGARPPTT